MKYCKNRDCVSCLLQRIFDECFQRLTQVNVVSGMFKETTLMSHSQKDAKFGGSKLRKMTLHQIQHNTTFSVSTIIPLWKKTLIAVQENTFYQLFSYINITSQNIICTIHYMLVSFKQPIRTATLSILLTLYIS